MTPIKENIARLLRQVNALTAAEIAQTLTAPLSDVQSALHDMDDAGAVILRNGFYRASERLRRGVE